MTATGTIDFNQRDIAVVQARTGGFVQRVYARAPGDIIGAGAPLADLLVPEWGGAQAEFLAVRRTGNAALTQAARQRLMLLGMSSGTIASVERAGRPHNVIRSEEHTSELQSLMRTSYAVFCLNKTNNTKVHPNNNHHTK